jgi:hypothetical protein
LLSAEITPLVGVVFGVPLSTHAAICTLRALRHNKIRLTTNLLQALAEHLIGAIKRWDDMSTERVLTAMQRFRQRSRSMPVSDKLRLCATLPSLLGLSGAKKHINMAAAFLKGFLAPLVSAFGTADQRQPYYTAVCFIHFLSRLSFFPADEPGYAESSKIATFFCEAMTQVDASRTTSVAETLLDVVDDMNLFVDKEFPDSNKTHLAAGVLRYVVERRCPKVVQNRQNVTGRTRVQGIPAALFMARPRTKSGASRMPVADTPLASSTPICDADANMDKQSQVRPGYVAAPMSPTQVMASPTQICDAASQSKSSNKKSKERKASPAKHDAEKSDAPMDDAELPPGPLRGKRPATEHASSSSPMPLKRPATERSVRSPSI